MGHEACERCEEDDLCARLLEARLRGEPVDTAAIRPQLRSAKSARKFFDPECDWAPTRDFELCTDVDAFDFVLRLDGNAAPPSLQRVDAPKAAAQLGAR
jgi:2-phosphosulfolactate phosphatase